MHVTRGIPLALALLTSACSAPSIEEPDDPAVAPSARSVATATTMDRLFDAAVELAPLALAADGLQTPQARARAATAIERCLAQTEALRMHATNRDPAFRHLASALELELRLAQEDLAAERPRMARHRTQQALAMCAECHNRTPRDADGEFGLRLFAKVDAERLAPADLAVLQQAARQTEAALQSLESALTEEPLPTALWEAAALGQAWLRLALEVRGDVERTGRVLDGVAARTEADSPLGKAVASWVIELDRDAPAGDALERARAWIEQARAAGVQAAWVPALLARHDLNAWLASEPPASQAAEGWLLLGEAHQLADAGPWLGQAPFCWATAVRTAPHTAIARQALERYETRLALDWGGSGGYPLPADISRERDELRQLAGGAP